MVPPLDGGVAEFAIEVGLDRGCQRSGVWSSERKLLWLLTRACGGTGPTRPPPDRMLGMLEKLGRLLACSCLSTMIIMITPTLPSEPVRGVQCIQRALPSIISMSLVAMLAPSSESGTSRRVLGLETRVSQETFAVTPMPCASASKRPSRTCSGPPM